MATSTSQVATLLNSIFHDPNFHNLEPSLWERVGSWWRLFNTRFGKQFHLGDIDVEAPSLNIGSLSHIPTYIIPGITILGCVIYFLVKARQHQLVDVQLARKTSYSGTALDLSAWVNLADMAKAHGDMREALRCIYQAALTHLSGRGCFRLDPQYTSREYLRMADGLPAEQLKAFKELTWYFEYTWYGKVDTAPDRYAESERLLQQITSVS